MHWYCRGVRRMGRVRKIGSTSGFRTLEAKINQGSACASLSDSIERDFRAPFVPNRGGQRQTQQAGLSGATIPCLRTPSSTQSFSFWNQPVAAVSEDCLRQLKMRSAYSEEVGAELATSSQFSASLLDSVLPGSSLQTDNALSEANPEV
jgi:hypothetical protein